MVAQMQHKALPLLFLLTLAPSVLAQNVVVVDDDGGPGLETTVQAGIDVAAPGSIVLVRPGIYSGPFQIDKALTLEVELGVQFTLSTRVSVTDLGPGDDVVLRGIVIDATGDNTNLIVSLGNCQGDVFVENCHFQGTNSSFFSLPTTMTIFDCARVVMRGSTIVGGSGFSGLSGPGIDMGNSSLFLFDSLIDGGIGMTGVVENGGPGGTGIRMSSSFLFSNESWIRGGEGGAAVVAPIFGGCPQAAGDGGIGIRLLDAGSEARLRNTALEGGPAGSPGDGCDAQPGMPGIPSVNEGGAISQVTSPLHDATVTTPVRTDEIATIQVTGVPGEAAFILFNLDARPVYVSGLVDVLVPNLPNGSLFLGITDGAGQAGLTLQPTLPPGLLGRTLITQPLFFDIGLSQTSLGPPSAVVVLDSSL